jgi:hypothetical protein
VEQEAAQELLDRQGHQALLVAVRRVSPAEGNLSALEGDEAVKGLPRMTRRAGACPAPYGIGLAPAWAAPRGGPTPAPWGGGCGEGKSTGPAWTFRLLTGHGSDDSLCVWATLLAYHTSLSCFAQWEP